MNASRKTFGEQVLAGIKKDVSELSPLPDAFQNIAQYNQLFGNFVVDTAILDAKTAINIQKLKLNNDFIPCTSIRITDPFDRNKITMVLDGRSAHQWMIPKASVVNIGQIQGFVEQGNIAGSHTIGVRLLEPFSGSLSSISNIQLIGRPLTSWNRMYEALERGVDNRFIQTLLRGKEYYKQKSSSSAESVSVNRQETEEEKHLKEYIAKLDLSKQAVMNKFDNMKEGMMLVIGPPGTGKTKTITAMIESAILGGEKVMICAPSNQAVQVLMDRFLKEFPHRKKSSFLVVSSEKKDTVSSELKQCTTKFLIEKEDKPIEDLIIFLKSAEQKDKHTIANQLRVLNLDNQAIEEKILADEKNNWLEIANELEKIKLKLQANKQRALLLEKSAVRQANVIFTTTNMAHTVGSPFNCLIVDEAGQALEPEVLIPLKPIVHRCVLVGDPNQLPPTVTLEAQKKRYDRSLLERLQSLGYSSEWLTTQYRCPPTLMEFSNRHFYNNRLQTAPAFLLDEKINLTPAEKNHTFFTKIDSFIHLDSQEEKVGKSYINRAEVEAIIQTLLMLKQQGTLLSDVIILTFYGAQRALLQRRLEEEDLSAVKVKSVDEAQGDEARITLVSFVRSNREGRVGFLKKRNRINVAFTRTRGARFCYGNADTLSCQKGIVASVVKHYYKKEAFFNLSQFKEMLDNKKPSEVAMVIHPPYDKTIPLLIRMIELGRGRSDYANLLVSCEKILDENDNIGIRDNARRLSAKILFKQKKYVYALSYYEKLEARSSLDSIEKANCYFKIGDYDSLKKAIDLLHPFCDNRAFKADYSALLAKCYSKLGSFKQALFYHEKACSKYPLSAQYQLDKAQCMLKMHNYEKSYSMLKDFCQNPNESSLRSELLLMICCNKLGRYQEAKNIFEKCERAGIKKYKKSFTSLRSEYLIALGEGEEALNLFEQEEKNSSDFLLNKAKLYVLLKKYDDAIQLYTVAEGSAEIDKNTLYFEMAICYQKMHKPREAIAVLEKMDASIPALRKNILLNQAKCHINLKNYSEANSIYRVLLESYPKDYFLRDKIAIEYERMNQMDLAGSLIEDIVEEVPVRESLYHWDLYTYLAKMHTLSELELKNVELDAKKSLGQTQQLIIQLHSLGRIDDVIRLIRNISEEGYKNIYCKVFYLFKYKLASEAIKLCEQYSPVFRELNILLGSIRVGSPRHLGEGITLLKSALREYPYSYEGCEALLNAFGQRKKLLPDDILFIKTILERFSDKSFLQISGFKLLVHNNLNDPWLKQKKNQLMMRFKDNSALLEIFKNVFKDVSDEVSQPLSSSDARQKEKKEEVHFSLMKKDRVFQLSVSGKKKKQLQALYQDVLNPLSALSKESSVIIYGGFLTDILRRKETSNDLDIVTDLPFETVCQQLTKIFGIIYCPAVSPVSNAKYITVALPDPERYGIQKIDIHCYQKNNIPHQLGSFEFNGLYGTLKESAIIEMPDTLQPCIDTIIPADKDQVRKPAEKISKKSFSEDPMLFYEALNGLCKIPGATLSLSVEQELRKCALDLLQLENGYRKRLLTKIYHRLLKPDAGKFFELMNQYNVTNVFGKGFIKNNNVEFIKHMLATDACKQLDIPIELLMAFFEIQDNLANMDSIISKYDVNEKLSLVLNYKIRINILKESHALFLSSKKTEEQGIQQKKQVIKLNDKSVNQKKSSTDFINDSKKQLDDYFDSKQGDFLSIAKEIFNQFIGVLESFNLRDLYVLLDDVALMAGEIGNTNKEMLHYFYLFQISHSIVLLKTMKNEDKTFFDKNKSILLNNIIKLINAESPDNNTFKESFLLSIFFLCLYAIYDLVSVSLRLSGEVIKGRNEI